MYGIFGHPVTAETRASPTTLPKETEDLGTRMRQRLGHGHILFLVPIFRCRRANDCVIAEARAVLGIEREWSDEQIAEDVFGIYFKITP